MRPMPCGSQVSQSVISRRVSGTVSIIGLDLEVDSSPCAREVPHHLGVFSKEKRAAGRRARASTTRWLPRVLTANSHSEPWGRASECPNKMMHLAVEHLPPDVMPWMPLHSLCPQCRVPRKHAHEPHNILLELLHTLRIHPSAGIFVDVGTSTDMLDGEIALKEGFKVLALEARQQAAAHVAHRFNASVAASFLDIRNLAVADTPGVMTLHDVAGRLGDTSSLASSAVLRVGSSKAVNVTVTTLDDLVGDAPCAVIKMDIQGYEIEALRGAASILARERAPLLLIEVCERLRPQVPFYTMFQQLRRAGYTCYDILSNTQFRMPDGSLRHQHRCCSSENSRLPETDTEAAHPRNATGDVSSTARPPVVCHDDASTRCAGTLVYTDLVCKTGGRAA